MNSEMIFYHALQEFFLSQEQNRENSSVHLLKDTLIKYGYNDAFLEEEFPKIVQIV